MILLTYLDIKSTFLTFEFYFYLFMKVYLFKTFLLLTLSFTTNKKSRIFIH